jgi:hypothetical protein
MNISVERALQLIGGMKVENALLADQIATLKNELAAAEVKRQAAEDDLAKLNKPTESAAPAPVTESNPG